MDNFSKNNKNLPLLVAAIISISTLVLVIFFSLLPNIVKMPLTKYKLVFSVLVERDTEYPYYFNKIRTSRNQYKVEIQKRNQQENIDDIKKMLASSRKYYLYDFKVGNIQEIKLDDVLSKTYYMNQNFMFIGSAIVGSLCDDSPDRYRLESTGYYDFLEYKNNPELMIYSDEEVGIYITNFFVKHKFYNGVMSECFGWTL